MEQLTPRALQWPSGRMPIATRGTFSDGAVDSDFFVSVIENQVLDLVQTAVPAGIQFLVEQLSGSTDLPTGDVQSTEFFDHCGNSLRRDDFGQPFLRGQF